MSYSVAYNPRNVLSAYPTAILAARDRDNQIAKYGNLIKSANPKQRYMAYQSLAEVAPDFQKAQIERLADNQPQRELLQLQKRFYAGKVSEMERKIPIPSLREMNFDYGAGAAEEEQLVPEMFAGEEREEQDEPEGGGAAAEGGDEPEGGGGGGGAGGAVRRRARRMVTRTFETSQENPLFSRRSVEALDVVPGEGTLADATKAIERRRGRPKLSAQQREDPELQAQRSESAKQASVTRRLKGAQLRSLAESLPSVREQVESVRQEFGGAAAGGAAAARLASFDEPSDIPLSYDEMIRRGLTEAQTGEFAELFDNPRQAFIDYIVRNPKTGDIAGFRREVESSLTPKVNRL